MFKKVDAIRMHVPDVGAAIEFYRAKLGLELLWRKGSEEAGPKFRDSDSEIVLAKDAKSEVEVDLLVDSVEGRSRSLWKREGRLSSNRLTWP